MRMALNDAAPLYRDAREAREAKASGEQAFHVFMKEVLPKGKTSTRTLAVNLIKTTLGAVGPSFSEKSRTESETATYADAMADMFCAYLTNLAKK